MKLVNVEDLKVLVAVESKGEIRYGKLVTDLFDDIPTVEAITIEWLESWKKGKSSIEQVVADKIMMDYKHRDYWEKENEYKESD